MAVSNRVKYGTLYDLIDTANIGKNKSVFHSYKPKADIGRLIFKELYARFQADPAKGQTGFYMDDAQEIGILSQCQSLQALLLLASDFGIKFDAKDIISADTPNLSIRQIMDMVIDDVLKRIDPTESGVYRFDASPYETKAFTVEYSNIEAMTWVIPCFLQVLKYHARKGETCRWEERLVNAITYALRYINDSFIENEEEGESKTLTIGWNFTKDCQEPSLYYSFTVCECFVDFFNTFEHYLTYKQKEKYHTDTDADKKEYEKSLEIYEYNDLRLRYIEINEGVESIDGSLYGALESKCKRVAHEIWRLCKEDLADKFYYNDLGTKISEEDIERSTTSDALFNTVYIINIMIDAGLDEDIKRDQENALTEEAAEKAEEEYNDLLEACQMALQKAFRAYDKLRNAGKEYIVEQFLVGFNEKFTTHKDLVKDLRKRRMRVFTLMPLLIRTNNVISEYLVKYPQANMRKYLGYILENRYVEKGKTKRRWIWERDGYFSCSNYYYVSALGEFYAYYETYESKYIEHYAENVNQRAAILSEQMESLRAPTGEIGMLKKVVHDREKEIAGLKAQLDNVSTPVEDAVVEVATEQMKRIFPELLCGFLKEAAKGITTSSIDSTECSEAYAELVESLKALFLAMMSGNIEKALRFTNKPYEERVAEYEAYSKHISEDIDEMATSYVSVLKTSPIHRSEIFDSNKGE